MRVQAMVAAQDPDPPGPVERSPPHTLLLPAGTLGPLSGETALSLRVTYPRGAPNQARLPVVVFFSGFLASAHWYEQIVDRVAAAGYAVVQYDGPRIEWDLHLPMVLVLQTEVAAFGPLITELLAEAHWAGEVPPGLMDTQRLFVAGHSRGGALASLVLAGLKNSAAEQYKLLGAYLLDPVDPPLQRSAGSVLCKSGLAVGITPANTSGFFNPGFLNFKHFYSSSSGSRLDRIGQIGPDPNVRLTHMMFCDAGPELNGIMDWIDQWSFTLGRKDFKALRALAMKAGVEAVVLEVVSSYFTGSTPPGVRAPAGGGAPTVPEAAPRFSKSDLTPRQQRVLQRLKSDLPGAMAEAAQRNMLGMAGQAGGGAGAGAAVVGEAADQARAVTAHLVANNMLRWFKAVQSDGTGSVTGAGVRGIRCGPPSGGAGAKKQRSRRR